VVLKTRWIRSHVHALLNEVQMDVTLSPGEALDHLLDAAVDRFGYSGRDVFRAVFNYPSTTDRHQAAFNIKFVDLEDAVSVLATNEVTARISHRILALSPVCSGPYTNDKWKVNFKSHWVAKNGIADQTMIPFVTYSHSRWTGGIFPRATRSSRFFGVGGQILASSQHDL